MDSDLSLFHAPLPGCRTCSRARSPATAQTPDKLRAAQPLFTGAAPPARCRSLGDFSMVLHLLSAFPAPSLLLLLLFKAVSERGIHSPGWPVYSQEWYHCLDGKMPCPGGMGTVPQRKDTWQAVGPGFFCLVFFYVLYKAVHTAGVDTSHHAMLSSLLLPQKPNLAVISSNRTTGPFVWVCFGQLGL